MGDIDAFLKVGRPDGATDGLGLHVLDEPCATQSEPAVLCLQLRASTKQSSAKALVNHSTYLVCIVQRLSILFFSPWELQCNSRVGYTSK